MNAARSFQRREDYQVAQTPAASPFRKFTVTCLRCGTYDLKIITQYDDQSGEVQVYLTCPRCQLREELKTR